MNRIKIVLISALIYSIFLFSCEDTIPAQDDAVKFTKAELRKFSSYDWFNGFWNLYHPDSTITGEIENIFDSETDRFYIFIQPGCVCEDPVKEPADLVKVLDESNIDEIYYEIYSMGSIKTRHPYDHKINIKSLPAVYLFKSGEPVYSIIDTFNFYFTDNYKSIESIVLDAMTNY
ncbi:hypothetical protein ACFLSQ_02475 [Bacteroidota bacterium]